MSNQERAQFFDQIAEKWDTWEDMDALQQRLSAGLAEFGIQPRETILDIGCGTGNLTKALLRKLSPEGRVIAIDIAPAMLALAQSKNDDPRVSWHLTHAGELPLSDEFCERIFCYSVWPHFDEPAQIIAELKRVLRPGGMLHIWHLLSREKINEIHSSADEAVQHDRLVPANQTAQNLQTAGFQILTQIDDDERYLITAVKPSN